MNDSERGPPSLILRNQLYHMDCMDSFPLIPSGSISLILTDPPYGISYQNCYSYKKHPKLEDDSGIDYERFAVESYRILQENAYAGSWALELHHQHSGHYDDVGSEFPGDPGRQLVGVYPSGVVCRYHLLLIEPDEYRHGSGVQPAAARLRKENYG